MQQQKSHVEEEDDTDETIKQGSTHTIASTSHNIISIRFLNEDATIVALRVCNVLIHRRVYRTLYYQRHGRRVTGRMLTCDSAHGARYSTIGLCKEQKVNTVAWCALSCTAFISEQIWGENAWGITR